MNLRLPIRTVSSSSPICASVRKISTSGRRFPKPCAKLIFFQSVRCAGRFTDVLIDCTGAALIWVLVYLFSLPSRISRAA